MKFNLKPLVPFVLLMSFALFLPACMTTTAKPAKSDDQLGDTIVYQIPENVRVSKVSYFYEDYKGTSRLHFEVALTNESQSPHRYRVNILLPQGPAVGGMYPRKKKAIEPGKTLSRKFPVYMDAKKFPGDFMPTGFTLVVKEL